MFRPSLTWLTLAPHLWGVSAPQAGCTLSLGSALDLTAKAKFAPSPHPSSAASHCQETLTASHLEPRAAFSSEYS